MPEPGSPCSDPLQGPGIIESQPESTKHEGKKKMRVGRVLQEGSGVNGHFHRSIHRELGNKNGF